MYSAKKIGKIAVLAGGPSSERDISLASGRAVLGALRRKGCDAVWLELGKNDITDRMNNALFDVAFIALHGKVGEDGTVQKILERRSRPYTGSGAGASRLALDKIASRRIFKKNKIPVPPCRVIARQHPIRLSKYIFPLIVKPSNEGSSIGLSVVRNEREFKKACARAFAYGDRVLVEKFIKGRELTVGILGQRPLPVIEIVPRKTFYDFHAKYRDTETKYRVPAALPRRLYRDAQRLALSAYRALGCSDFSRVDMRLGENNKIYVLEVNTIPGLTERSLLPKAARARGIGFDELCLKMVRLAIANKGRKK